MQVYISVFFSGTNQRTDAPKTLINFLMNSIDQGPDQKCIAFHGCYITHGVRGALFGSGLDEQCQEVIELLEKEIRQGNTVSLTVLGHSRGGEAAKLLALQLSNVDPKLLTINLALLDPVPGNYLSVAYLDPFNITLANKLKDLRDCKPLKKVLALYPHEPLDFFMAHAPSWALYPENTLTYEIIPGCHSEAQYVSPYVTGDEPPQEAVFVDHPGLVSFARIFKFFQACGTQFKPMPIIFYNCNKYTIEMLDEALKKAYEYSIHAPKAMTRAFHSDTGRCIETRQSSRTSPSILYFNKEHQKLCNMPIDESKTLVRLQESHGPISFLKRLALRHPRQWKILKWSIFGLGITSLLFFTGGLGSLSMLGKPIVSLGLWNIPILSPLVSLGSAGSWYLLINPCLKPLINGFFYPKFHFRDIQGPSSPQLRVSELKETEVTLRERPEHKGGHAKIFMPETPDAAPVKTMASCILS